MLVVNGTRARSVQVPGVSGRDVEQLLVSRDGSRLVAVVAGEDGDRVVAGRILHDDSGRVLGATRARTLAYEPDASGQVRDIAWRTPTAVSVLSDITDDLSQVRTVSVDGAPGEIVDVRLRPRAGRLPAAWWAHRSRARRCTPSPARTVIDLTAPTRPLGALPSGLTSLTYVG